MLSLFITRVYLAAKICRDAHGPESDARLNQNVITVSGFLSQAAGTWRAERNRAMDEIYQRFDPCVVYIS